MAMMGFNVDDGNKDWVHRRQIRLLQVRKQSSDIAKRLRERAAQEEIQKLQEKEQELEAKVNLWKINRINDLEQIFRDTITDIGTGHKLAVEEVDVDKVIIEKQRLYICKAKERGVTALENELKERREALERKRIPIQRKLITRQIENIRSSLVRSLPIKTDKKYHSITEKPFDPSMFEIDDIPRKSNRKVFHVDKESTSKYNREKTDCTIPAKQKKSKKIHDKKFKGKPSTSSPAKTKKEPLEEKCNLNSPKAKKTWVDLRAVEVLTKENKESCQVEEDERIKENTMNAIQTGTKFVNKPIVSCTGKGASAKENKLGLSKEAKNKKDQKIHSNSNVCYAYSMRHGCNSKDEVLTFRKIDDQSEMDANELAIQEENSLEQGKKVMESNRMVAEERGIKAVEKEKITHSYNDLISKLEKLSVKEKVIKSYCRIPLTDIFMSDERRKEKNSMKQRKMDSKFERIYYDVMGLSPDADLATRLNFGSVPDEYNSQGDGDTLVTKLDLGQTLTNIKTNSPASSICDTDIVSGKDNIRSRSYSNEDVRVDETIATLMCKQGKLKKQKVEIDLAEIDKILEKCRELRESTRVDENVQNEVQTTQPIELSEGKVEKNEKTDPVAESVLKEVDPKVTESEFGEPCFSSREKSILSEKLGAISPKDSKKMMLEDLGAGDLPPLFPRVTNNIIAWPVLEMKKKCKNKADDSFGSTSTSYKSLPPIRPKNINCILMILEQLKEREGNCTVADELIVNLEHLLDLMIRELEDSNMNMTQEVCQEFQSNPRLQYYISKLLDMSRERIANLSVSSGSEMPSPRVAGFCGEDFESTTYYNLPGENKYLKQENDLSRESRIKRAMELERIIKKWKCIIEQNVGKCPQQSKCHRVERMDGRKTCPKQKRKGALPTEDRYEAISKKCSDRMSILSDVLAEGHQKHKSSRDNDVKCSKSAVQEGTSCQKCIAKRSHADSAPKNKCERSGSCKNKSQRHENVECPKLKSCKRKEMENRPLNESGVCDDNTSTESFPDAVDELLQHDLVSESIAWSRGTESRNASPRSCSHYNKADSDSDIVEIEDYFGEPGYQCNGIRCPYRNDEEGLFIAQCSGTCRSPCSDRYKPVNKEESYAMKSSPCISPVTINQTNDEPCIVRPISCPSTPVSPCNVNNQKRAASPASCSSKPATPCKTNEESYAARPGSCPSTPVTPHNVNNENYTVGPCPYTPKSGTPHKVNEETCTVRPGSCPSTPGTPHSVNQQTYILSPGSSCKRNGSYAVRPGSCLSTPGTPQKINEETTRPCSRPSTPGTPQKINQQTYNLSPGSPHKTNETYSMRSSPCSSTPGTSHRLNETYTVRPGPCPSTPGTPHKLNETYTVRPASSPPTPGFKMVDTYLYPPFSPERSPCHGQRQETPRVEGNTKTPVSLPTMECSWNAPAFPDITDPVMNDMEHGIYSPIERTMSSCNATDASERNQADFSATKIEELMRRHAEGIEQRLYEVKDVKPEELDFYSQMYETSRAVPCVIDGQDRWNASGVAWREGGGKRAQLQRLLNEPKAPPPALNETGYRVNFSPGTRPKTPVQPANFFPDLSPIQGPFRRGGAANNSAVCEHACDVHCNTSMASGKRPVSASASTPKKDRVDRLAQSLPNVRTSPHQERINSSRRPCPKDVSDMNEGELWMTLRDASVGEEYEIRRHVDEQPCKSKSKPENVSQMKMTFMDLISEMEGGSYASGCGSNESE